MEFFGFDREVSDYADEKKSVGRKLFWSIVSLFLAFATIFICVQKSSFESIGFYLGFGFTSPLIYLVWHLSLRYSHIENLVKEYRYKRAASNNLTRNISQIRENLEGLENEKEISKFLMDKYNQLYQETL